ncbi:MAG: NAD(P)/FAD-dependent oxidoreductase [bacterium]
MDKVNITIIGAGAVGLAIASELSLKYKDILVLEKNARYGEETSSRNSEVIHSGIYYPESTLKASLCVRGKQLLYDICQTNDIRHKQIGKYIVAVTEEEKKYLQVLTDNGKRNGVDDLYIIDRAELKKREPAVQAFGALVSPSTGILDTHELMSFYYRRAKANDVVISFNSQVSAIEKKDGEYKISIKDEYDFSSHIVINAAGLYSDQVAAMPGLDIKKYRYQLHPCKGIYYALSKNPGIKHLIYPVPTPRAVGLGIHVTLDLDNKVKLGPNAFYIDNNSDYDFDDRFHDDFQNSVTTFIPDIIKIEIHPDMAGIRPKLQGPHDDIRDFVITEESSKNLPNFINLIGIESPGITASPAIAKYVKKIVDDIH